MAEVCKKCHRTYHYPVCEFCAREEIWKSRSIDIHVQGQFTPRMLKEFEEYSSRKMDEYIDMLTDNMESSKGSGTYIWNNTTRTGKTILAMFLFVELLKRAYINGSPTRNFRFTSMMDILDKEQKFRFAKPSETWLVESPINIASYAPLLVLDDFGTEKGFLTPTNYEAMYKLINYRYEYLLPTIFTSNNSLEGLATMIDDARIPSRVGRMCSQIINFHFKNI